ncbi:MAG: DNA topoisomerase [Lachnospiraceae bacterium]|nr:DNA topoisomerase [Lachnospiraceae bacterium]
MGKAVYIAEKPSVANEFAKALKEDLATKDGYKEGPNSIVTWCVGHLVSMSYPESYDPALKKWSFDTIPFIPTEYKYEVIGSVTKQFKIVSGLLNRDDVDTIYVCTDSGREGEYIYRLVEQQAHVTGKKRLRVWIDSQTEEEILRGIREAKDLSEYDNLSAAAYLRAKEDYLMGINFSRALTLKYGYQFKQFLNTERASLAVGRVMTCVLGMVVKREREIRSFTKTPFYRILAHADISGTDIEGEWRSVEGSKYFQSPVLYSEKGFKTEDGAKECIKYCLGKDSIEVEPGTTISVAGVEKKKEKKNAPLLYNLAEIQNDCSKYFKINPDQTLNIIQTLYEKKLVTYPRTDARVLSTAVSKEIHKNIGGLRSFASLKEFANEILESKSYTKIASTKYVNDKLITDHYAIIPTGQGLQNFASLSPTEKKVYELIARRFLAIFMPPAVFEKVSLVLEKNGEKFFSSFKVVVDEGYRKVMNYSFSSKNKDSGDNSGAKDAQDGSKNGNDNKEDETEDIKCDAAFLELLSGLKKGSEIPLTAMVIKEGETQPPKRYNSGSMILAMENAGQFIEDEDLRAQIKGSGIGTSATRAGILTKLVNNKYLALNAKTQIITPTLQGEMLHDVVMLSIQPLLNPALTASWEKGLSGVADGTIEEKEYMDKLTAFVTKNTQTVKSMNNSNELIKYFKYAAQFYKK